MGADFDVTPDTGWFIFHGKGDSGNLVLAVVRAVENEEVKSEASPRWPYQDYLAKED